MFRVIVLLCASTQAGCAMNDHAMRYLQCTASLAEGEQAERLWLDARAVFDCEFDINGHLWHGR